MKPAPFAALLAGGAAGVDASTTAREGKMREKGGMSGMAGVGGTRVGELSDVISSGANPSRAVYNTLVLFASLVNALQWIGYGLCREKEDQLMKIPVVV